MLVHTVHECTVTVKHNWSLASRLICTPTLLKGLSLRGSGELIKLVPFWRAKDSGIKLDLGGGAHGWITALQCTSPSLTCDYWGTLCRHIVQAGVSLMVKNLPGLDSIQL